MFIYLYIYIYGRTVHLFTTIKQIKFNIMNRIVGPERELRNKTLQDGLKAYVVKPIKKLLPSYITLCNLGNNRGRQGESNYKWEKKGIGDVARKVVFYVSCIQSFEKRSCAEKKAENTESLSENHETPPDAQEKEYHLSLAFWMAVTEGDMETMKALLMQQILASGMDIFDIRKIESRGKDKDSLDLYAKTLGNVLKDHKHFSAVNLSKRSTSYLVQCVAEVEGHDIDMDSHLPATCHNLLHQCHPQRCSRGSSRRSTSTQPEGDAT